MCHHRGRRRVLDLGVGDDADRHAMAALHQAGDVLDLRIVERVGRAVGVDAHRIDRRLVAGGVGAHGVRRIGDDGIGAGGGDQRHVRHVVDGELAARFAFADALGEDARRDAVRGRHPVADEQDHVLRLAPAGLIDGPRDLARVVSVAGSHRIGSGLRQRNVAQDEGRHGLAVLALDKRCSLTEDLGVVLAVQGHQDFCRIGEAGKLDLEIEPGAGQDLRAVDRIDRLRMRGRTGNDHHKSSGGSEEPAHIFALHRDWGFDPIGRK